MRPTGRRGMRCRRRRGRVCRWEAPPRAGPTRACNAVCTCRMARPGAACPRAAPAARRPRMLAAPRPWRPGGDGGRRHGLLERRAAVDRRLWFKPFDAVGIEAEPCAAVPAPDANAASLPASGTVAGLDGLRDGGRMEGGPCAVGGRERDDRGCAGQGWQRGRAAAARAGLTGCTCPPAASSRRTLRTRPCAAGSAARGGGTRAARGCTPPPPPAGHPHRAGIPCRRVRSPRRRRVAPFPPCPCPAPPARAGPRPGCPPCS